MAKLDGLYQLGADIVQAYHGDASALSVTRLGTSTAEVTPATLFEEKTVWRSDPNRNSGSRHRVITRRVVVPRDVADIPVGSQAIIDSVAYRAETVKRSPASGCQVLLLTRNAVDQVSRPNSTDWS
ncbi:MAG: hypothetical protein AAFX06_21360 [Planctomycetota bacterium]